MAKKRRRLDDEPLNEVRRREHRKSAQSRKRTAGRNGRQNISSSRKRKKGGLSTGKKVLVAFCSILLIFVLAGIVGVAYIGNKMGKINTSSLETEKLSISDELEYDESGYLNVALFGLDSRANDPSMGSRSDAIIIASLNRKTKEVKMVSVYRDTLMQLDDGDYYKANAAYAYGEEEEAIAMLNRNLDMNISKYVTVDFSALSDVIDAVGGIEVDVTYEEVVGVDGYSLNGYILETAENSGRDPESNFIYASGLQTLNGVQATAYARIRFTDGSDYKRSERQRLVLTKVAEKLQESSLSTINKVIDKAFPKVKTNFTMTEVLAYAKDVAKYKIGDNKGFPMNSDSMYYGEQGSIVISTEPLADVKELHKFLFGEDGYTPSSTVTTICSDLVSIYSTGGTSSEDYSTYDDTSTYNYSTYDSGYTDGAAEDPDASSTYSDSENELYGTDGNIYDDSGASYGSDVNDSGEDTVTETEY